MNSIPPQNWRPDVISLIATFGAPLLVGSWLLYSIINGHWGSVAVVAIIFAVVIVFYVGLVRFDDDDDETLTERIEDERENDAGSSSGKDSTLNS